MKAFIKPSKTSGYASPNISPKTSLLFLQAWVYPDDFITKFTNIGIYAMAMGEETMDILNLEEL